MKIVIIFGALFVRKTILCYRDIDAQLFWCNGSKLMLEVMALRAWSCSECHNLSRSGFWAHFRFSQRVQMWSVRQTIQRLTASPVGLEEESEQCLKYLPLSTFNLLSTLFHATKFAHEWFNLRSRSSIVVSCSIETGASFAPAQGDVRVVAFNIFSSGGETFCKTWKNIAWQTSTICDDFYMLCTERKPHCKIRFARWRRKHIQSRTGGYAVCKNVTRTKRPPRWFYTTGVLLASRLVIEFSSWLLCMLWLKLKQKNVCFLSADKCLPVLSTSL